MISSIIRVNPEFSRWLNEMNEKTGWSQRRCTDMLVKDKIILEKLVEDEKFNKCVYQLYKQLYENQ